MFGGLTLALHSKHEDTSACLEDYKKQYAKTKKQYTKTKKRGVETPR